MGLVWLLNEHGDALEADFERYYHIDLLDLYRGLLSPRKAQLLALHLPPGAATWQEAGTDTAWDTANYQLADAIDALHAANWQRAGGKQSDRPKPYPRPADLREQRAKRERMLDRASRFKERQRQRKN